MRVTRVALLALSVFFIGSLVLMGEPRVAARPTSASLSVASTTTQALDLVSTTRFAGLPLGPLPEPVSLVLLGSALVLAARTLRRLKAW